MQHPEQANPYRQEGQWSPGAGAGEAGDWLTANPCRGIKVVAMAVKRHEY